MNKNTLFNEDFYRRCNQCGIWKNAHEYSRDARGYCGRKSVCKECKKQYDKKYCLDNREKRRQYAEEYNRQNAHKRKEWYEKNREYKLAQNRSWQQNNLDKCSEYSKRFRKNNPEAVREIERKYRLNNPQVSKDKNARRRAIVFSSEVSVVKYDEIWIRDDGICQICYSSVERGKEHYDHIKPLSRGGAHVKDNIQVTHARCNLEKGNKYE